MCLKFNTIYRIKQYYRNKKQTFSWEQKEIIDMFMIFENIYNTGFPVLKSCRNNKKCENLEYYFITYIFPNVKLKSGFRISCSVRRKLFEESTTTALTPDLLGISTFLGFLKSGGNLNGVTAMWRPIYLYLNIYR